MNKDLSRQRGTGLRLIGWLEPNEEYPTGETPREFREKLFLLASFHKVNVLRSRQFCELCLSEGLGNGDVTCMTNDSFVGYGGAELIVLGKGGEVYLCPDLICHYVCIHNYLPPIEFVEAVLGLDLDNYELGKEIITTKEFLKSRPLIKLMLKLRAILKI